MVLVLGGLTLFALSNKIGIGILEFDYPLGAGPEKLASIFHASGRMFWPVYYSLVLGAIFVVVRGADKRTAMVVLAMALGIQVFDTSAGWRQIRERYTVSPKTQWATPLASPFWSEAARRYRKLRVIMPGNHTPGWRVLASYAGTHGMATDAVYLARVGASGLGAATADAAKVLRTGTGEGDTLYILDERATRELALGVDPRVDLLARIDGFNVLAPGWKTCDQCSHVEGEIHLADLLAPLRIGQRVQFAATGAGVGYLAGGWSTPEPWGTWSDGGRAEMLLPLPAGARSILLEAQPLLSSSHPRQTIEIRMNGVPLVTVSLTAQSSNRIEIPVSDVAIRAVLATDGLAKLDFSFPDAARPRDIGINEDSRRLALGLQAMTIF